MPLSEFLDRGWPLLFMTPTMPGRALMAIPEALNEGEKWVATVCVANTTTVEDEFRDEPDTFGAGQLVAVDLDAPVYALNQVEPFALRPADVLDLDGDEA